jgi:hypothetical protein
MHMRLFDVNMRAIAAPSSAVTRPSRAWVQARPHATAESRARGCRRGPTVAVEVERRVGPLGLAPLLRAAAGGQPAGEFNGRGRWLWRIVRNARRERAWSSSVRVLSSVCLSHPFGRAIPIFVLSKNVRVYPLYCPYFLLKIKNNHEVKSCQKTCRMYRHRPPERREILLVHP